MKAGKMLLGVAISVLCSLPQRLHALSEDVRIAVIIPLSGEAAGPGRGCQNGITLALEAMENSARNRVKVIFEDDQNNPTKTVTAFRKVQLEDVEAVITFTSGTSKAIAPLAEQAKIPLIAIASDPEIVRERRHVVNLWVTPQEQARVLAAELERRSLQRVARISTEQAGMLAMKSAFDQVHGKNISIVLDADFGPEVRDFRSYLARLKTQKNVDAVFVNLYLGQAGVFARQAREIGIDLPLVNIETFEDQAEVEASKGALINQWYVQADDARGEFGRLYRTRFPSDTPFSAGNCHDALKLAVEAKTKGISIVEHLHSVRDFSGAMGTYSARPDNTFSLPATVKVVTEHGFEKVS